MPNEKWGPGQGGTVPAAENILKVVLKVCFLVQEHNITQRLVRNVNFRPVSDLQNQKLRVMGPASCALRSPPGNLTQAKD